ncbi:DMT family transporter, partial [Aestuariivirga sp.]|uniref:DMT family transporter n=1 Tax=Aestuariivirga sp. TaxID=2650926 RepID=UPI0037840A32
WQMTGMSNHLTATRLLVAAAPALFVLMWATGFVVARYSAPHASPFAFLSIRFPIAGLLFVLIALVLAAPWPGARQALHATVAGAFLHGGYLGPVYWAVAHGMPAGVSALIVGLQPLMTAILAAGLVGERIALRHWLGLAIGIAGVALVVSPKLQGGLTGGITALTVAVNVAGALSISFGTVYQKRFATALNLASGGAWQYAGATLVVLVAALLTEDMRFDGTPEAWFALAWSVIVLSLAAISLLMLLIRLGDVGRVASLIFLVPGVSALMAYGLFGETLTAVQILGMAVCAGAVLIVTRKPVRPA